MVEKTRSGSGNRHIGISLDEWLEDDGMTARVDALVHKRHLSDQLRAAMKAAGVSESAMAKRMKTTRAQVRFLLDPANESMTLRTAVEAGKVVGLRLDITFKPITKRKVPRARRDR